MRFPRPDLLRPRTIVIRSRHARAAGGGAASETTAPRAERESDRLAELGTRRLFTVAGTTYLWDDALAWAEATGLRHELECRTRRGLALRRGAPAADDRLGGGAVSAAAAAFRYERRLLSAEELEAWLARWALTTSEWGDYIERTLLLGGEEVEPDTMASLDGDLAAAEYVDAVCSGFLTSAATGLAADVALAELAEDAPPGADRRAMVARTVSAAAAARERAKSAEGVEREIARRALDWTRLDLEVLEAPTEGVAREAALCVRVDGRALAEVARSCGTSVRPASYYLSDLEPALHTALIGPPPGELVGPVQTGERFVLCLVRARTAASSDDGELRRRAETALVERAVKRATEARVEWHEQL